MIWNKHALKSLVVPGGILLLAAVLLQGGVISISSSAAQFFYFATFAAGLGLALRFGSSRVAMLLVTLLLADRAIGFFALNHGISSGPGRAAYEVVSFLLPLNFLLTARTRERSFILPQVFTGLALLFAESVFVTLVSGPGARLGPAFLHHPVLDPRWFGWARIPPLSLLCFVVATLILALGTLRSRKPLDSGFPWALAGAFLALHAGALGRIPSAYFATAALILACALVESSYFMAFHDELTSLPGRRAFDQAILALPDTYAVAMVDIDHFKKFNDNFGHDTGDEVLRMVATRLAGVSGGGRAFRVGGEEFSILFAGVSAKEAANHLETLRSGIERSAFRVRERQDRRTTPRGADRRRVARRRSSAAPRSSGGRLSVTVSIGVAEPGARRKEVAQVIGAADQALYRAKQTGRNRVEIAASRTASTRTAKRSIA